MGPPLTERGAAPSNRTEAPFHHHGGAGLPPRLARTFTPTRRAPLVRVRRQTPHQGDRGVTNPHTAILEEFTAATTEQETAQKRVDELGATRARLLTQLNRDGLSYRKISALLATTGTPMSAARVQKMVERARTTQ